MAKRNRKYSVSKYEKWIKEGRGQGEGVNYKPWLKIQDISSKGVSTRSIGWKSRRIHHFLSQLEYEYYLTLEWSPTVIDIREQYPLLPIERTIEIAKSLNIEHPNANGEFTVMTTDFYITLQTELGYTYAARTVKPISNLDARTLEKFEIERRFYEEQEIDWGIVTDYNKPEQLIRNLDWIIDAKNIENRPQLDKEMIEYVAPYIYKALIEKSTSITKVTNLKDREYGFEPGTCLFILKHMIATKRWLVDMYKEIEESRAIVLEIGMDQARKGGTA